MEHLQFAQFDVHAQDARPRLESLSIKIKEDQYPDASYLEQEGLGFEDRLEQYRDGRFYFVGIYAEAVISLPFGKDSRHIHVLQSGGLWGIESDSGAKYFEEIARQELAQLRDELKQLHIPIRPFRKLQDEAIDRMD